MPVKQLGPVMSSVSSLNHLTVNGGMPLNVLLKRTVALGSATCGSGSVTKLGGSEEDEIKQVKESLVVVFETGGAAAADL